MGKVKWRERELERYYPTYRTYLLRCAAWGDQTPTRHTPPWPPLKVVPRRHGAVHIVVPSASAEASNHKHFLGQLDFIREDGKSQVGRWSSDAVAPTAAQRVCRDNSHRLHVFG
mmetsp:Transcript_29796/g.54077  ORF Transcript_29796/g.54077 Transcript_29796/m.54077 type:complete len:114 (+) Transcript_29796:156-497(+)